MPDISRPGDVHSPTKHPKHMDIAVIDFPSDALSIKRLRKLFPELFHDGSSLSNGCTTFFSPDVDESSHLDKLNDLLSAERTLADYFFYNVIDPYPSKTLDDDAKAEADEARSILEQLYVEFKLADSPETARLLIQIVEQQGAQQGNSIGSPTR